MGFLCFMPPGILPGDLNFNRVVGAVSSLTDSAASIRPLQYDLNSRGLTIHVVGDDSAATGINGGPVTVGTTEVEMTFAGTTKSIMIQSDPDNIGKIWIGLTGVTNSGENAMVELEPGSAITMNLNDTSAAIFAISDTATQNIHKMALT
ncbi:hypothetical protein LCGC14_0995910 [marine sediment metagenome]|uniref:Uncharacterized protein n=1 Tax=marine sediment metagenome TaxID=412755 RepID=A0A0F9N930_9ZZZZ